MCYSPVRHSLDPCGSRAFDLHVLGTPPAFILSQDQTRHSVIPTMPHAETGSNACELRSRPSLRCCCSYLAVRRWLLPRSFSRTKPNSIDRNCGLTRRSCRPCAAQTVAVLLSTLQLLRSPEQVLPALHHLIETQIKTSGRNPFREHTALGSSFPGDWPTRSGSCVSLVTTLVL
jgi:hypothetical protein